MQRRTNQTRNKKKQQRNQPRRMNNVVSVNRAKTPWPIETVTHLRYTDEIDLTLTSGSLNNYVFHSNGLYDPDNTGTGHQPLAFDQYAVMYNKYRVLRCKYKVVFGNVATNGAAVRCSVAHLNGGTIPARPAIFELGNSKQGVVGPYGQPLRLQGTFDLTKLNTRPEVYRTDDRYAATISSNPAEAMHVVLSCYPNVSSTIRISVEFTYQVHFYDNETPSSSLKEGVSVNSIKKQFKSDQLKRAANPVLSTGIQD